MQTNLAKNLISKTSLKKVDKILRTCVHCGFCLSACPTYKILGDEVNSPRGRIYTIKTMFEEPSSGKKFDSTNLDKCLTCRSCETACPSGVEYAQLLEIGREFAYKNKNIFYKLPRFFLRKILTTPFLVNIGAKKINNNLANTAQNTYTKSILLHTGCVQKPLAPNINFSATKVLNKLGFNVIDSEQKECCGAIDIHNGGKQDGLARIRKNIDKWLEQLKTIECIISTASGCGLMIKDYPHQFEKTDSYYQKANLIANKTFDISEFLSTKDLSIFNKQNIKVSYHEPCTLQHGQKLAGTTHQVLKKIGYQVDVITDNNLCCGSAGTYSIFQPKLAKKLRIQKLTNLGQCDVIATSNIGCLMHLQKGTKIPVKHWIELL